MCSVRNISVKVDVDGVIRDIFTPMCDLYNSSFGVSINPDDVKDYDVEVSFPLIKEKFGKSAFEWFFVDHADEIFLYSKPFPKVAEALRKLRGYGVHVMIVTWQHTYGNKVRTLKFLERNGIEYDDILFTKEKWRIGANYIIDDNPEFLLDDDEKSVKIMVDAPYNRQCKMKPKGIRVDSLSEAIDSIL